MTTTRKDVLDMLAAGQLNVDEAADLLNALKQAPAATAVADSGVDPATELPPESAVELEEAFAVELELESNLDQEPEFTREATDDPRPPARRAGRRWLHIQVSDLASGESRVRVNVPVGLIRFGLKVGAQFSDEVNNELIGDVMTLLNDHELTGTLVEVEAIENNERVHIYID